MKKLFLLAAIALASLNAWAQSYPTVKEMIFTPEASPTGTTPRIYFDSGCTCFKFREGSTWSVLGGLPTQTGNAGKYLTTDGSNPSWATVTAGISLSDLSATLPLAYNSGTGVFSIQPSTTSQNGYLSNTDWNIFNAKESALTFTSGLTRSTNTVTVNTSQNISTLSNLTSNGLIKTTGGTGALSIATSGTDYAPATSGTSILKASGGGFANAADGTDYLSPSTGWKLTGTSTITTPTLVGNPYFQGVSLFGPAGGSVTGNPSVEMWGISGGDVLHLHSNSGTQYFALTNTGGFILNPSSVKLINNSLGGNVLSVTNGVGLWLANSTVASSGNQQIAPWIVLEGQGWGTTAGTSQSVRYALGMNVIQGTTPAGNISILSSINSGAYTSSVSLSSVAINTPVIQFPSGGSIQGNSTSIYIAANASTIGHQFNHSYSSSSSNGISVDFTQGFSPSSGTTTWKGMRFSGIINQTGGANGATTMIDAIHTLTAAVGAHTFLHYKPTETSLGTHYFIANESTTALSGLGTGSPAATLDIRGSGSTNPALRIASGGTSTEYAFRVQQSDVTTDIFWIKGNGDMQMGLSGSKLGFFGGTAVVQQSVNTILVNNVTSGGSLSTIADYSDLTIYANDANIIRNNIFRLTEKVLKLETALRNYTQIKD